jgi:hypothetical protein
MCDVNAMCPSTDLLAIFRDQRRWHGGHAQVTTFISPPQRTTLDGASRDSWHCIKLTAIVRLFPHVFELGANLPGKWESLQRLR